MEGKKPIKKCKMNEIQILLLIFLFGVLLHFISGDFFKKLTTYPDELRYYSIAKSFFSGNGLTIRGAFTDFQKIGYAFLLVPTFLIKDPSARIRVINLMNSCLMMSAIFPTYGICKELKLKQSIIFPISLIIILWPDTMLSMTFMSENLYWPLFLCFMLLWIKSRKTNNFNLSFLCGIVCYLVYLTKEVFLSAFISCILFELMYPIMSLSHLQITSIYTEKKLINLYEKDNFKKLFLFVTAFLMCHLILKVTIFYGMGNSYNQQGLDAISKPYNFIYMLYAFAYYLIAIVTAYFIFPVSIPAIFFDKLSEIAKKVYFFAIVFLTVASAIIAYTISVREDLGRVAPRLHFRYFGPIIIILLCIFAYAIQYIDIEEFAKRKKKIIIVSCGIAILIMTCFRGCAAGSAVDQYVFEGYQTIIDKILPNLMPPNYEKKVFYIGAAFANFVIVVWLALGCKLIIKKRKQKFTIQMIATIIIISLINDVLAVQLLRSCTGIDESTVAELQSINAFVGDLDDDDNIIYFTDASSIDLLSQAMDTYVDRVTGFYYVDSTILTDIPIGESINVTDIDFKESIWERSYGCIETADYIILESETDYNGSIPSNCTLVSEVPNQNYYVFKNNDPTVLKREYSPEVVLFKTLDINFTGDGYNATSFVSYGIGSKEDGFSWTDGDEMHVEIPCSETSGTANVTISVIGTFNGPKRYSIVEDNKVVTEGSIDGTGVINFKGNIIDGMLSFELNCEDAEVINEVYSDSTDTRKVAFAIDKISVIKE